MNKDERIAERYLKSLNIGEVAYEPDGKIPPDFLVNGCIAVEVRRLNQHYEADGKLRSGHKSRRAWGKEWNFRMRYAPKKIFPPVGRCAPTVGQ